MTYLPAIIKLVFGSRKYFLWFLPFYTIFSFFLVSVANGYSLTLMFIVILAAIQGQFLREYQGFNSSFLLPNHNAIQILFSLCCNVLFILPPVATGFYLYKFEFITEFNLYILASSLAISLGYYRNAIWTNVVITGAAILTITDLDLPVFPANSYSLFLTIFNLLFYLSVFSLILRVMNKSEFDNRKTSEILRLGLNVFQFSNLRSNKSEGQFGDADNKFLLFCNRQIKDGGWWNHFLIRQISIFGDSGFSQLVIIAALTLLAMIAAIILRILHADIVLISAVLLLSPIIITAPFINEVADLRKRVPVFWLRDNSLTRKSCMRSIAWSSMVRLLYPMAMWLLLISLGCILADDWRGWIKIYLVIVCYFPICLFLSFSCGLINKGNRIAINTTFSVIHIIAMICCLAIALVKPDIVALVTAIASVAALLAVYIWTEQEIEIC